MKKLGNWFTKEKAIIIGMVGSIVILIATLTPLSIQMDVCYRGEFCGDISEALIIYFALLVHFFFYSVIVYFLKEDVFVAWRNFSVLWLLPFFLLISLFPYNTHGLDFLPMTKGIVSNLLTIIYSIISLLIILYKSLKKNS